MDDGSEESRITSETAQLLSRDGQPQRRYGDVISDTGRRSPAAEPGSADSSSSISGRQETAVRFRIAAAMFSFVVMGVIMSTVGVMIPRLKPYYGLTDVTVSFVFLTSPVGYVVAAYFNNIIHLSLGQRGIATIASLCQLAFAAAVALHPPYPVVLVMMSVGAFGTGLLDASWCAWAGGMKTRANTVQGCLHGSYSVGACLGPFLAGSLLELDGARWHHWYAVIAAALVLQLTALTWTFRHQDAAHYRKERDYSAERAGDGDSRDMLRYRATWVCGLYFLINVGTESSITGWIVEFMMRARHATIYFSSICDSAFGASMAVGRVALGPLTDRIGVRRAVVGYLLAATVFQALFAAVPDPVASGIFVSFVGFFLGPMFPSGIVSLAAALPKELHVAAVAFVATIGQVGGAIVPFGIGALAEVIGIEVFQVVILALILSTLVIWMVFPRGS